VKANLLESRPTSLPRFFAETVFWFLLLVVVWMPISPWTSYPAGWLTHFALEEGARQWVRKVHRTPQLIEADTNIRVAVGGNPAYRGAPEFLAVHLADLRFYARALSGAEVRALFQAGAGKTSP